MKVAIKAKKHADSIGLRYARYKIPIAKIIPFQKANPHAIEPNSINIQVKVFIY